MTMRALQKSLTEIEPYDIGRSVDIVHSLNPAIGHHEHWICRWGDGASSGSGTNCCMAIAD